MIVRGVFDEIDSSADISAYLMRHLIGRHPHESGPTFSTKTELIRLIRSALATSAAFAWKSRENGPSNPIMLPAQKMRLPGLLLH